MKRLVDNIFYDTDKSELLATHRGWCIHKFYRSLNGRYFVVWSGFLGRLFRKECMMIDYEGVRELFFLLRPDIAFLLYDEVRDA